jgi:tetratricopeptide (TPR) repeat protein
MAYEAMGDIAKGLAYQEKALEIRQQILPATHPDLARSYNNVAGCYIQSKRYAEALDYARKVLAIYQQHFDNSHPKVANLLKAIPLLEEKSSAGF